MGEGPQDQTIAQMLDALFAPNALGPAPVDPEEQRRLEEERRRQEEERRHAEEERQRQEAQRAADALRQRAEARQRRQQAYERAHPIRTLADAGPVTLGGGVAVGTLLSSTRPTPSNPISHPPSDPSSLAFGLRVEGAYALTSVPGFELGASLMIQTAPSTAAGLGVGAQYSFPARSRLGLRCTAGALVGIFHSFSGAKLTSAWLTPFVRAEYAITPSIAVFAGAELDFIPGSNGGFTALSFVAGMRFRFGGDSSTTSGASTSIGASTGSTSAGEPATGNGTSPAATDGAPAGTNPPSP